MRYLIILSILSSTTLPGQVNQIDSLNRLLSTTQDSSRITILLGLSLQYETLDYEKARTLATQAENESRKTNNHIGEIKSLYAIGMISIKQGDWASSLSYFQDGIGKAENLKDEYLVAEGQFNISRYHEAGENFLTAIEHLNQALEIFIRLGRSDRVASCYVSFGHLYKGLANYEQSLNYFFKALEIREASNAKRGVSVVLSNIGSVYLLTSKFEEANKYFLQSLAIDRVNGDQEGISTGLLNLGVVNQKMELYDNAIAYYDSALILSRKYKFKINEAYVLGNTGSTLRSQKKYKEALPYLFSALDIKKELGSFGSAAHTCNDICETYLEMKNPHEAKKYALMAIELSTNTDINQLRVGYYFLADCDYALNNFKDAYDYLVKADVITDSIFSVETTAKMDELEVQYQAKKKEEEIKLLQQENEAAEFRRNAYVIAGIVASLFLFLLYNRQRLKSRKNRELLEKGKEIDRMKSRFFANISHEFRTPLTLILGPIEELNAQPESNKIQKYLSPMRKNATRLLELVNQLLELSRIESGNQKPELAKINIVSIVKGVTMSFSSLADTKNIKLEVVAEDLPDLFFDRDKIEKVLYNLISNAFKFTPDAGSILVTLRKTTDGSIPNGNECLEIIVKDTGEGIQADEVAHIFDRFYQADNNQLQQQDGSGIGLALSKELVEMQGGIIKASSVLNVGTEVCVQLPLDLDKRMPDCIKETQSTTLQPGITGVDSPMPEDKDSFEIDDKGNKPIVLIIEDNLDVRYYIRNILDPTYSVVEAIDGEEGVATALEQIPDLILCDVMMPKMDGHQVCKKLKSEERTSHIPFILLTAKADVESRIEGLETLADDYLTKPFVPRELLVRIQNLIESRRRLRDKYLKNLVLKPGEVSVNSVDEQFLTKIVELTEQQIANEHFGVEEMSEHLCMSRSQLFRKLKALIGQGPNQFIRSFRLNRAHDLLKQNAASASEIAYSVGFSSPSYFTKCFHDQFGYTPSEFREKS